MECARSSSIILVLSLCCVFIHSANSQWAVDDDGCRTPNRGVGSCIEINSCTSILEFLSKFIYTNMDSTVKQVIRKYQCGITGFGPKVCCPSSVKDFEWVYDDSGCRTPDRGVGNCIGIYSCKPMMDFLESLNGNANEETSKLIQSYRCGQDSTGPKVCCPSKPITLPVTKPVSTGDVAEHVNVRLLPMEKCGTTPLIDRILNGNKTRLFEFPWMAILKYSSSSGTVYRCGGTLISNRYVLTAAHCVLTKKLVLIGVRLGEHDLDNETDCETHPLGDPTCAPPVQDFEVSTDDTIVHPDYNKAPNSDDIALIRLRKEANTTVESVNPVCLPIRVNSRNNQLKKKLTVTGWGATEKGVSSADLLKVSIPVVNNSECEKNYENVIRISPTQICAGGKNWQDSCAGDSGGPLTDQISFDGQLITVQYGIVSFGPTICGRANFPGVYTRVTSYLPWILDNIKE